MGGEVQVHGRKGKHLLAPISEAEGRIFFASGQEGSEAESNISAVLF